MRHVSYSTICAAYFQRLDGDPQRVIIRLFDSHGTETPLSYERLFHGARAVAGGLRSYGVKRGDRVVLSLPTSEEFFGSYLGCVFSGVIPAVVPAPRPRSDASVFCAGLAPVLRLVDASLVVVPEDCHPAVREGMARPAVTVSGLREDALDVDLPAPSPQDVAHLQLTSGTTGQPRAAVVSHGNVAHNVLGIGRGVRHRNGEDVLTSWLPMFHDMGLIGLSYTLYWDCPLVSTDPGAFVTDPMRWLRLIDDFDGTLSPAPNSAYQICMRIACRRPPKKLDLSRWRVGLCGSEPVQPSTLRGFNEVFAPYGLRSTTLLPVYGLAESTLCATMPDPDSRAEYEPLVASELQAQARKAVLRTGRSPQVVECTCLGRPLEGLRLRIVDDGGRELPERRLGNVEIRGESIVSGYWGLSAGEVSLHSPDGYLQTGDVGYLANGQLFITDRSKDLIIVNGRNFSPSVIEAEVEAVLERPLTSGVAAVGVYDARAGSELVHVVIETRGRPRPDPAREERCIHERLDSTLGLSGVFLHWVPRKWIPKTTSGKIRRNRCRQKLSELRDGSGASTSPVPASGRSADGVAP